MGKKKKFIDKKKSATFQLMARDTSDPNYSPDPLGDRVFVRVDNSGYMPESFPASQPNDNELPEDPNSIFADAPESENEIYDVEGLNNYEDQYNVLPDHVRKEILELGFPDDGYNYLTHLREIKNLGGGAVYYTNPKTSFDPLPQDVKAYDASKVGFPKIDDISTEKYIYSVTSQTVGVRLQKVVDPEVAAILDDSSSSIFGSDIEELEEDFVLKANLFEGSTNEDDDIKLRIAGSAVDGGDYKNSSIYVQPSADHSQSDRFGGDKNVCAFVGSENAKTRIRRPLDEQFDLFELQEYGTGNGEQNDYEDEDFNCQESLAEKLNHAFKDHPSDSLNDGKVADDVESAKLTEDMIRRCKEYAAKYDEESPDETDLFVESIEQSEVWDCETVVTTYSTLDNHPGIIDPTESRRKKLANNIFGASSAPNQLITLKGKEKLPIDFLPNARKHAEQKSRDEKSAIAKRTDQLKRKAHGQESKEEKKERKFVVKLEKREARQRKKELKGIYKSEAQHAKKLANSSGPASIHLM